MRSRIVLGRAQHAQHVAAGDLFEVGLGIAAPRQFGEQRGIARNVAHPLRRRGHAVKIAAQPDMVHADARRDVIDMIGKLGVLGQIISNPPTQAEVAALQDKVNAIVILARQIEL